MRTPEALVEERNEDALTTVVGIGVIVVSKALSLDEPMILTAEETGTKEETGKAKGKRAIIQETVKATQRNSGLVIEDPRDTLLGGLAEVMDQSDISTVGGNFHRVVFPQVMNIHADLPSINKTGRVEVVVYDGPPHHTFTPLVNEMTNPQWTALSSAIDSPRFRPTSRELLTHAQDHDLIPFGMDQYRQGQTESVFDSPIHLRQFYQKRERKPDVTVFMR